MLKQGKFILLAASLVAASAWAQSVVQPLNLRLPSDAAAPQTSTVAPARDADSVSAAVSSPTDSVSPDSHYDAAANRAVDAADAANRPLDGQDASKPACNDADYTQTQVHGSVGMGVVAGNHVSGNYQTGSIRLTKATGSCDHPTGGVSLSINVGRENFGRGRWRH